MPCFHPWPLRRPGERPIVVSCGQCVGCRLERSRQWAMRCVHESQLHKENCFITLTYRDDALVERYLFGHHKRTGLPVYAGTLYKRHFQDFIRRLRRFMGSERIAYFHCGEYGEEYRRPHYHALIFGMDWPDKLPHKSGAGNSGRLFTSAALERLWGQGFCTTGALTFQSAAYCSRYIMKKITGDLAESHYERVCLETGEIRGLLPEYITMSLKPAIGLEWFNKFREDVYPADEVICQGRATKPPRFYDKVLRRENPEVYDAIKAGRQDCANEHHGDETHARLRVREAVRLAQLTSLKRELE